MKRAALPIAIASLLALAAPARAVMQSPHGLGQVLFYPYYAVNKGQDTLLSLTNTDTVNAKVAKVRVREGRNGRAVADLDVFLAPGDVWTAVITQVSADGGALVRTSDASCTLPVVPPAGLPLSSGAYDGSLAGIPADSGPYDITRTREGFVESTGCRSASTMWRARRCLYTASPRSASWRATSSTRMRIQDCSRTTGRRFRIGAVPCSAWLRGRVGRHGAMNGWPRARALCHTSLRRSGESRNPFRFRVRRKSKMRPGFRRDDAVESATGNCLARSETAHFAFDKASSKYSIASGEPDCPSQKRACFLTSRGESPRINAISAESASAPPSCDSANTPCSRTFDDASRMIASVMSAFARASCICAIQKRA